MKIQFYTPGDETITVVDVKNFEFLPLFYLFPKKLLQDKCPSLVDMPRSVHGILKSDEWVKELTSDYFTLAVCDITAYFVWPAFGMQTSLETFSGDDPLWRLAHATSLWGKTFEEMSGIIPQQLAQTRHKEREWEKQKDFEEIMYLIGLRGIHDNKLQSTIEAIRDMRCPEDFDDRISNARIDFYRKWYHSRTRFSTVSLDQLVEVQGGSSKDDAANAALGDFVEDTSAKFEDDSCSQIDTERFSESLSARDREILQLRINGATYQEIADKLAYKTHSAVIKRIKRIANKYNDHMDEREETREFLSGS